jgi:type IV secretory pathway VirB9-like protein
VPEAIRVSTQDLWYLFRRRIPFPESLRSAKGRNSSFIIPAFFAPTATFEPATGLLSYRSTSSGYRPENASGKTASLGRFHFLGFRRGRQIPSLNFVFLDGNGITREDIRYKDFVQSYSTAEPAIDLTASSPLAFAWAVAGAPSGTP